MLFWDAHGPQDLHAIEAEIEQDRTRIVEPHKFMSAFFRVRERRRSMDLEHRLKHKVGRKDVASHEHGGAGPCRTGPIHRLRVRHYVPLGDRGHASARQGRGQGGAPSREEEQKTERGPPGRGRGSGIVMAVE